MLPINLLVVEDHLLVRAGICALLEKIPGITIIGEGGDGYQALKLVARLKPDIVLMDIALPKMNGLEAAARMVLDFPGIRIIILSAYASEEYVLQALHAGAVGYLLKNAAIAELEMALSTVAQGETYLSPPVATYLAKYIRRADSYLGPLNRLTSRQREILQLLAEGHTNRQIAGILHRSIKTIETHRTRLMKNIGVHDIAGLVRFAIRMGVVSPDN